MNTKKLQKTQRTNTKHLVPHGRRTYLQGTAHLNKKYNGKMKNKQSNKQTKKERSCVEVCHVCKYLQQRDIESFGRFQKNNSIFQHRRILLYTIDIISKQK